MPTTVARRPCPTKVCRLDGILVRKATNVVANSAAPTDLFDLVCSSAFWRRCKSTLAAVPCRLQTCSGTWLMEGALDLDRRDEPAVPGFLCFLRQKHFQILGRRASGAWLNVGRGRMPAWPSRCNGMAHR